MNKWRKIAEIRQHRIDELKEDNQRYRDEIHRANNIIQKWVDLLQEYEEKMVEQQ